MTEMPEGQSNVPHCYVSEDVPPPSVNMDTSSDSPQPELPGSGVAEGEKIST